MATGTVKFFNVQRGFGFIQPSDGSRDVFVHVSAVERAGMQTLVEGQKVSYDVVTERGKQTNAYFVSGRMRSGIDFQSLDEFCKLFLFHRRLFARFVEAFIWVYQNRKSQIHYPNPFPEQQHSQDHACLSYSSDTALRCAFVRFHRNRGKAWFRKEGH